MINEMWCTSFIYWLIALIIIYPPDEAISAGLTTEILLKRWLGSENRSFILYHIKRTSAILITNCLLLPGYVAILSSIHPWFSAYLNTFHSECYITLVFLSMIPVSVAGIVVLYWYQNDWGNHPLVKTISLYKKDNRSLNGLVNEINREFTGVHKFSSKLNSVSRIVATENWLIKVSIHKINLISMRDFVFNIVSSENITIMGESSVPLQYINVHVKSLRKDIDSFNFKLNSIMWKELEVRSVNPVINMKNIMIHQSLADRFFPVFNETVEQNPKVTVEEEPDSCIGCMSVKANVLIKRRCKEFDTQSACMVCFCKPMWCLPCLSKWFAARQNENEPNNWLSSRAPCPTCRSTFCMLDVHLINTL